MLFGQPGSRRVSCMGFLLAGSVALAGPAWWAVGQDDRAGFDAEVSRSQASAAAPATGVARGTTERIRRTARSRTICPRYRETWSASNRSAPVRPW